MEGWFTLTSWAPTFHLAAIVQIQISAATGKLIKQNKKKRGLAKKEVTDYKQNVCKKNRAGHLDEILHFAEFFQNGGSHF